MCEYEIAIKETFDELFTTKTLIKKEIIKYYIDNLYASSSDNKYWKLMNPHLQTQEVKQLKYSVETQLTITNVVLRGHKEQI